MLILLLIIPLAAYLIYRYYENERHYWTRKGIPGPTASWLWGNLHELLADETARALVLKGWTKKYGKVYGIHEGQLKQLVISDLRMLEEMLTKKFDCFYARAKWALQFDDGGPRTHISLASGPQWKRLRALSSPAFSNNSLKKILPMVEKSALIMIAHLENTMEKGEINMLEFYQEYTMDIICKLALGKKDVKMFQNPTLKMVKGVLLTSLNTPIFTIPNLFPFLDKPMRNALAFLGTLLRFPFFMLGDEIAQNVAERKRERAAGLETSQDFIDMFLDAEVDASDIRWNEEDNGRKSSRRITIEEVPNQCLIFILAGFDTTSNTLAYVTHLLANHPKVQERLSDEIDSICTTDEVTWEQLSELKYTECVIKETLRHYPLANFFVSRECAKSTTIGDLFIEKGTQIHTDTWTLHMNKEIWGEDAEEFRPERWLEESDRARVAFLAFGEGPRICIGMRLALLEMKIALAHLLKKFTFAPSEQTNPLTLTGYITLAPRDVFVKMQRRALVK